MRQTHTTRQAVRPGAEQWHGNSRKEGPDPHRFTHRNHASKPGSRLRIVAALGGVAFVEESSTG
jgi:hypothetical protein